MVFVSLWALMPWVQLLSFCELSYSIGNSKKNSDKASGGLMIHESFMSYIINIDDISL
jgi:hypothetical protein